MSTFQHCETPRQFLHRSWPLKFFEKREYFSREAENVPYVDWLRDTFSERASDWGEDTEDDGDGEEKGYEEDRAGWLREGFFFQGHGNDEYHENIFQNLADAKDSEPPSRRSIARTFMEGMAGDHEALSYRNQVDVVAGFCEQEYHAGSGEDEKAVALLDDMNHKSGGLITQNHRRVRRRPLSAMQLRRELGKPVSAVQSYCCTIFAKAHATQRFLINLQSCTNTAHDKEADVERRIL
jgi:hypothetical protein